MPHPNLNDPHAPHPQSNDMRGSSASRSPSPTKLMHSTASTIANPGGSHSHGRDSSTVTDCAAFSMLPHDAVGGCTPSPKNERPASVRIAVATPKVDETTIG